MQYHHLRIFAPLMLYLIISLLSSAVFAGTTVIHNGKPFFPIGIYHYPKRLPLQPRFEELANAGFNTVLSPLTTSIELMDTAWDHGIGVIPTLGWNMILDTSEESKKAVLREHVERLKDHPALLGYEAPDEIAWVDYSPDFGFGDPGRNMEGILKGYSFMKSIDPDHPIWMNHAPRNSIEYLKSYSEGGDILGTDIYPVPEGYGHSDMDQTLNCVAQYTEKLDQVGEGKPIYMVLQGFQWDELPGHSERKGMPAPEPSWTETRFMVYDGICHGANGIIYWGMAYTEIGDEIWENLKRIASELRDLTPMLLDGSFQPMNSTNPDLEIHAKIHDGWRYLVVLNTKREEVGLCEIQLPAGWCGMVRVLFEDRSLPVVAGRVSDSFGPYDVHIYSDDPRPDIALIATNPEILEKDQPTDIEFKVQNLGKTFSPSFNLSLTCEREELARTEVEGLASFSSRLSHLTWIPTRTGNLSIMVVADPDFKIDEITRTNNDEIFTVLVGEKQPDLRVSNISILNQDIVSVEISNSGFEPSEDFQTSCRVGDIDLPILVITSLLPGESYCVSWRLPEGVSGAVSCVITVDTAEEVDEMLEGNNKARITVYMVDLFENGAATYSQDLAEDGLWIIKYDPSKGVLPPHSDTCTLVWGINGWKFPPHTARNSRNINGTCESVMSKGLDGLWYVVIPSQEATTLEFRFRDRIEWGINWDNNNGKEWRMVQTKFVTELLREFGRVVDNGSAYGVDMSSYEEPLHLAWSAYLSGDNNECLFVIEDQVELAGRDYARHLWNISAQEIEAAKTLGIDVSHDERLLFITSKMLDRGNYLVIENDLYKILNHISEEMSKIPEFPALLALYSLSLIATGHLGKKYLSSHQFAA